MRSVAARRQRFAEWNCRWTWTANRGEPWVLRRITPELLQELHGRRDTYWSIERFTEDALGIGVGQSGQVDAVAPFVLDLDGHDRRITNHSLIRATWRAAEWLRSNFGLEDGDVFCWFSGRGFHIALPAELVQDHPKAAPTSEYRKLAHFLEREHELTATVKELGPGGIFMPGRVALVDLSIYSVPQLLRVPGTINSKGRLTRECRKVRIPIGQLKTMAHVKDATEAVKMLRLMLESPWPGVDQGAWL